MSDIIHYVVRRRAGYYESNGGWEIVGGTFDGEMAGKLAREQNEKHFRESRMHDEYLLLRKAWNDSNPAPRFYKVGNGDLSPELVAEKPQRPTYVAKPSSYDKGEKRRISAINNGIDRVYTDALAIWRDRANVWVEEANAPHREWEKALARYESSIILTHGWPLSVASHERDHPYEYKVKMMPVLKTEN